MAKMPKEVMDLLNSSDSSKVLATRDIGGTVNAVPLYSLIAAGDDTVGFAEIFIKKTKENLEKTKKATALVFKAPTVAYQLKGTFVGFQTAGPLFEKISKAVMDSFKLPIKAVGTIRVEEIYSATPGQQSRKIA